MGEVDSLVKWLSTLGVESVEETLCKCDNNPSVLSDGIILADCLHQIAPFHFDSEFLAKIKREDLVDYRLKANNLKKVVQFVTSFYQEVLFQELDDQLLPDETRIAADCDGEETSKLLRLVLGCAINCDQKEEYISGIMALEQSIQQDVMNAIQILMSATNIHKSPSSKGGPGGRSLSNGGFEDDTEQQHIIDRQLKEAWDEVHRLTMENEELSQKYHDIQLKMDYMGEEKEFLIGQLEAAGVPHKASRSGSSASTHHPEGMPSGGGKKHDTSSTLSPTTPDEHPSLAGLSSVKYKKLQEQYDELTHENYRLEAMKDDLRGRCEEQEQEIQEMQEKMSEMSELAKHARQYKDEVDELRSEITKTAKLESQVDTLKKKLEEMGDMKRQLKVLEEKNLSYMQNNFQLEEETRKLATLRQQVENYRLQMQKLEQQLMHESKRADRAHFDLDKKAEKMEMMETEMEKLRVEKQQLREEMDEMSLHGNLTPRNGDTTESDVKQNDKEQLSPGSHENSFTSLDSPRGTDGMLPGEEFLSPQIKEKISRLTHENRTLKRSVGDNPDAAEKLELLRVDLEDEQRRRADMESENRLSNKKVMELESRVEELQTLLNSSNSASDSSSQQLTELRHKLHEYMDKTRLIESESEKRKLQLHSSETKLKDSEDKLKSVRDLLSKKENDMRLMEERYKKYLEKAKTVMTELDPRNRAGVTPEIQTMKNQLTEKEKQIQQLEGIQLHRQSVDNRLANSAVGGQHQHGNSHSSSSGINNNNNNSQSFLSKHRGRSAVNNTNSSSGRPPMMSYVSANAAPMTHGNLNSFQTNSSYVTEQQWIQAQQMLPNSSHDTTPNDASNHPFANQSDHFHSNAAEFVHMGGQSAAGQNAVASHGQIDPSIYPQFYMQFENSQGGFDSSRPSSVPYPSWSSENNSVSMGSSYEATTGMFFGPNSNSDYTNPSYYSEKQSTPNFLNNDIDFPTLTRKNQNSGKSKGTNSNRNSFNLRRDDNTASPVNSDPYNNSNNVKSSSPIPPHKRRPASFANVTKNTER
ncbi:protein Hook homolog 3-like isoform X3 [Symsagittifera roscoffensis]|uniref:protein Hook homolog 3-like isoform X3 n=1 Tax=Symsagittifera roscoffensis TaxID=84072 RepID=UPI00307C03A0